MTCSKILFNRVFSTAVVWSTYFWIQKTRPGSCRSTSSFLTAEPAFQSQWSTLVSSFLELNRLPAWACRGALLRFLIEAFFYSLMSVPCRAVPGEGSCTWLERSPQASDWRIGSKSIRSYLAGTSTCRPRSSMSSGRSWSHSSWVRLSSSRRTDCRLNSPWVQCYPSRSYRTGWIWGTQWPWGSRSSILWSGLNRFTCWFCCSSWSHSWWWHESSSRGPVRQAYWRSKEVWWTSHRGEGGRSLSLWGSVWSARPHRPVRPAHRLCSTQGRSWRALVLRGRQSKWTVNLAWRGNPWLNRGRLAHHLHSRVSRWCWGIALNLSQGDCPLTFSAGHTWLRLKQQECSKDIEVPDSSSVWSIASH